MASYLSLNELSRTLGRAGQKRLMRFLIQRADVPTIRVGKAIGVHPDDVPRLKAALRAWDERPRVCSA